MPIRPASVSPGRLGACGTGLRPPLVAPWCGKSGVPGSTSKHVHHRHNRGGWQLQLRQHDLSELIADLIQRFAALATARQIKLVFDGSEGMVPAGECWARSSRVPVSAADTHHNKRRLRTVTSIPSESAMPIVSLQPRHAAALQAFLADFAQTGETTIPAYFPGRDLPHNTVVSSLAAWGRGEQLQPGWVPCTTAFLEVDTHLVGVVNVRHQLTDGLKLRGGHVGYSVAPAHRGNGYAKELLRWALGFCAQLHIEHALLTTDAGNGPSRGVIEACGGQLVDRIHHPSDGKPVLRYRVPTPR